MLKIKTVKKGAELVSVKANDIEKMHDGESFWNRHSPVLFPIVGKLKDGKTIIEGKEYDLAAGQSIIVDTGYLAAMTEGCTMDIQAVKGVKNAFLGGEDFFHTRITGPGKVYIQSMPIVNIAGKLTPYLNIDTNQGGSGGINIRL